MYFCVYSLVIVLKYLFHLQLSLALADLALQMVSWSDATVDLLQRFEKKPMFESCGVEVCCMFV